MIYNHISTRQIIAKIVRDLGLGPQEVAWADMVEWIAEGLEHIGAHYQFQEKEKPIEIIDYKGELPCNFYKLMRLKEGVVCDNANGMTPTPESVDKLLEELGIEFSDLSPKMQELLVIGTASLSRVTNSDFTDNDGMISQSHMVGNPEDQQLSKLDYKINGNGITTGFRMGFVTVQYLAWPFDEEGFPTVPDDVSYRDGLFWKVVYQLSLRGYDFKNPQLKDMEYCRRMWGKYCVQARASANMPDGMMMERLKNNWLRLVPDYYPESTDYKYIGRPQRHRMDGTH